MKNEIHQERGLRFQRIAGILLVGLFGVLLVTEAWAVIVDRRNQAGTIPPSFGTPNQKTRFSNSNSVIDNPIIKALLELGRIQIGAPSINTNGLTLDDQQRVRVTPILDGSIRKGETTETWTNSGSYQKRTREVKFGFLFGNRVENGETVNVKAAKQNAKDEYVLQNHQIGDSDFELDNKGRRIKTKTELYEAKGDNIGDKGINLSTTENEVGSDSQGQPLFDDLERTLQDIEVTTSKLTGNKQKRVRDRRYYGAHSNQIFDQKTNNFNFAKTADGKEEWVFAGSSYEGGLNFDKFNDVFKKTPGTEQERMNAALEAAKGGILYQNGNQVFSFTVNFAPAGPANDRPAVTVTGNTRIPDITGDDGLAGSVETSFSLGDAPAPPIPTPPQPEITKPPDVPITTGTPSSGSGSNGSPQGGPIPVPPPGQLPPTGGTFEVKDVKINPIGPDHKLNVEVDISNLKLQGTGLVNVPIQVKISSQRGSYTKTVQIFKLDKDQKVTVQIDPKETDVLIKSAGLPLTVSVLYFVNDGKEQKTAREEIITNPDWTVEIVSGDSTISGSALKDGAQITVVNGKFTFKLLDSGFLKPEGTVLKFTPGGTGSPIPLNFATAKRDGSYIVIEGVDVVKYLGEKGTFSYFLSDGNGKAIKDVTFKLPEGAAPFTVKPANVGEVKDGILNFNVEVEAIGEGAPVKGYVMVTTVVGPNDKKSKRIDFNQKGVVQVTLNKAIGDVVPANDKEEITYEIRVFNTHTGDAKQVGETQTIKKKGPVIVALNNQEGPQLAPPAVPQPNPEKLLPPSLAPFTIQVSQWAGNPKVFILSVPSGLGSYQIKKVTFTPYYYPTKETAWSEVEGGAGAGTIQGGGKVILNRTNSRPIVFDVAVTYNTFHDPEKNDLTYQFTTTPY